MTAASSSALFNATRYRRGSAGVGIGAAGGAVSGSVRSVRSAGGSRSRQRAWRVVAGARPRSGLSSSTPLPVAQRSYERVSARDRDAVLNALDQLGQRITIGDVAKRSGLDVATVEDVMRDVAADVDGFSLEVSEAGDIVYVKPGGIVNVRTALLGKSALLRVEPVLQKSGVRSSNSYTYRERRQIGCSRRCPESARLRSHKLTRRPRVLLSPVCYHHRISPILT